MANGQTYEEVMKKLAGGGRRLGAHNFPGAVRHDGSLIMTQNMWIEIANTESKSARSMKIPKGRGIDTIFVIDISESMMGPPYEKAVNVVRTFLDIIENVNRRHRLSESVALVTVGHKTEVLHHLTCDYGALRTRLDSIQVGGRTPVMAGLFMALSAINGRGSITVMNGSHVHPRIILLTDSKFTDSESTTGQDSSWYGQEEINDEILNLAARLGAEHHSIHCINVGDVENPEILQKIAEVSDGSVTGCDMLSVKKLGRHFKNMAAVTRMRRSFSLSWKNRRDFESVVHSYESDVDQSDIDDMMYILQYKLTDTVEEDAEFLDGSAPALGTRVMRGPQWVSGNQDGEGPGTVVRHSHKQGHVFVEWDFTRTRGEYSYQEGKKQIVTSQVQRVLTEDDLIATGCLVCRGDDWQWGFQDGGPENVGVVYDVQQSGLVHVRWPNGHSNWYRFGAEGMFDVRIWEPNEGINGAGFSPTVFQPRQAFLPPKPSRTEMVTSASTFKTDEPAASATQKGAELPETDNPSPEVPPNTPPAPESKHAGVSGLDSNRKHVLPPTDTSMPSASPISMVGSQSRQLDTSGPMSLSAQTDLSIDHAMPRINTDITEHFGTEATRTHLKTPDEQPNTPGFPVKTTATTSVLTHDLSPEDAAQPPHNKTSETNSTSGETADSKEDDVFRQDVEWHWFHKKRNQWVPFSEANMTDLEIEKNKKRKNSSKTVKINDTWYRVFLNTMKLQKVNSRESTPVRRAIIPRAIKGMRKEMVDKYMKLLAEGSYPSSNIRLMVVGNDRVGKTSLCRNMLKDRNFGNVEGTDGIEVFVNSYQINTTTKEKKKLMGETEHVVAMQKLACATVYGKSKKEKEEDIEMDEGTRPTEETDSVPHFPQTVSRDLPGTPPMTFTPTAELENRIEQININQPIEISKTAHTTRSNYVVSKKTGEITIPDYVKRDVDIILDEADKLRSAKQEDIAYLSMWDFGGEKIFYDTHHIFLSKDAVYLLCFNVKKCQEDCDFEPILFWLRSIATYSECSGKSRGPPVILIGTHTDELEGTEEEKQSKFEKICARITSNPDVQPIKSQIMNYFCVDNTKEGDEKFDNILDAVLGAAPHQSQWKMDIPTKWLALEREIMKIKRERVKTFEEIVELNKKMEVPIEDEEEIRMFLRYLHLMGYIMYFDEDVGLDGPHRYRDLAIIIDPQWVIYAFRRLITNPKNIEGRGCNRMVLWNSYVKDGHLTTPLIDELWNKQKEKGETDKENFLPYKDLLLTVMERLGLLAPPVSNKSHTDNPDNVDYYIVPSMLEDVDPNWVKDLVEGECFLKTPTLRLTLGQQFISLPVFHKLLAVCLAKFKLPTSLVLPKQREDDFSPSDCIKKGFGCLNVSGAWKVILAYSNSAINITLFTYNDDESVVRAGVGVSVRQFLQDTLVDVLRLQGQNTENLTVKYCFGFDILNGNRQGDFASKEEIESLKEKEKIFIQTRYLRKADSKLWFCTDAEMDEPIPVAKFLPLKKQRLIPERSHLIRISKFVCLKGDREKECFGFGLGLEKNHIDTILSDYQGTEEQAYRILLKWKEVHSKGTIGDIIKALRKYELDCGFFYKKGKVFD